MRREERVTVQGPVKEQQPDGMSHRGGKTVAFSVTIAHIIYGGALEAPTHCGPQHQQAHIPAPRGISLVEGGSHFPMRSVNSGWVTRGSRR